MPTSYNLPGTAPRDYTPAYGGVPGVPDPTATAAQALYGDIGQLGNLYQLATGVGSASAAGARTQLEANLPQYGALTSKASQNIAESLAGQVPADVLSLLGMQAAERGAGFGSTSPNTNAAFLRALGLTSLQRQDLGQQQLTAAIGRTPTGPQFDPNRMLVTPEMQQQAQYMANLMAAAPNPKAAADAAQAALNRGLGTGAGSVPGLRFPAYGGGGGAIGGGGGGDIVGRSTGTGTTIGGQVYQPGQTPGGPSQADWWKSIGYGLGGAAGGSEVPDPSTSSEQDLMDYLFGYGANYGAGGGESYGEPPVGTTSYSDVSDYGWGNWQEGVTGPDYSTGQSDIESLLFGDMGAGVSDTGDVYGYWPEGG